ncbi:tripartite tricarboxylate transporter substrate binding protein [Roseateles sp. YR242]|uniref:Bug family tripartite tricarboxylate transporter substrate binding protein n=1 Tax=Roseateles sp. YR242 TaxID=1855305 RepID=UPI002101BBA2|nr:tripartite tricarboxylate transporter substrate binding protein [Roseateles sp. YR242]
MTSSTLPIPSTSTPVRGISRRSMMGSALMLAAPLAWSDPSPFPKPGATIRYVVPFTPGGLTDVMARQMAQQLSERLNVNVIVENKPGAGAMAGVEYAARSTADGTTLLAVNMTHSVNATLFKGRSKIDWDKDLKPVALLAGTPVLVVVPADSKVQTLADLVAAAKARSLNAGSSGIGTPSHLSLAVFNQLNATNILHVPYKGGSPSLTDLIAGQVDVIFSNFPESIPFVKAGKLRAIAIGTAQRHPQVPNVPTTAEAGMPTLNAEQWTAVMVPAGTPDLVVDKLGAEFVQIRQVPEVAKKSQDLGFRVDPRGPKAFGAFWNSEVQRWRGVIEVAGITAE